jgi:hypothetical protein
LFFDRLESASGLLGINLDLRESPTGLLVLNFIPHQRSQAAKQLFFGLGQDRSGERGIHAKPMCVVGLNVRRLHRTDIEFAPLLLRLPFDALMRIWIRRFHGF